MVSFGAEIACIGKIKAWGLEGRFLEGQPGGVWPVTWDEWRRRGMAVVPNVGTKGWQISRIKIKINYESSFWTR